MTINLSHFMECDDCGDVLNDLDGDVSYHATEKGIKRLALIRHWGITDNEEHFCAECWKELRPE